MNITLISDTHGFHNKLQLTGGDLLIHSGDVTAHGSKAEKEVSLWLHALYGNFYHS